VNVPANIPADQRPAAAQVRVRHERVFALAYQPSACRLYQPAALPKRAQSSTWARAPPGGATFRGALLRNNLALFAGLRNRMFRSTDTL
jgi:hypothetical protein